MTDIPAAFEALGKMTQEVANETISKYNKIPSKGQQRIVKKTVGAAAAAGLLAFCFGGVGRSITAILLTAPGAFWYFTKNYQWNEAPKDFVAGCVDKVKKNI